MSKSTRFFDLIQLLRRASGPLTAAEIAAALEVSKRTVYRDIATLQSMQTPILGEPGIGYVMRKGYDLPAINFDTEEAEAIAVGLSLVARTGDAGLWRAAKRAARKLSEVDPGAGRVMVSSWGIEGRPVLDPGHVRRAIREERKIRIRYADGEGAESGRVIWPLVLIYYVDAAMMAAWCELRQDLRHFRLDRVREARVLAEGFEGKGAALVARWEAEQKAQTVMTRDL